MPILSSAMQVSMVKKSEKVCIDMGFRCRNNTTSIKIEEQEAYCCSQHDIDG